MGLIRIQGGRPLFGALDVQGSKNAALPILAASVLIPGKTVIENCPEISDTACMCEIIKSTGAQVYRKQGRVIIDASEITEYQLPLDYVSQMRSSVVLTGALLGRLHRAKTGYPGGCVIGDRPIDQHLKAFRQLGAVVTEEAGELLIRAEKLRGTQIRLDIPSVGATQNALLAAVLAKGQTVICGCAGEPEVVTLCSFLKGAGAKIKGEGSGQITVDGVEALHESCFLIPGDRIVAGTYLIGVMAAGGEICLRNIPSGQLRSLTDIARRMGAGIFCTENTIRIKCDRQLCTPGCVETESYPGFPTDLQSQMMTALCRARGCSQIRERIFNGRFGVVGQLNQMGACIVVEGDRAFIRGDRQLKGCTVKAQELRGGAALVLAGLCADGITLVQNRIYIDRGYENICRDLKKLGAKIDEETQI